MTIKLYRLICITPFTTIAMSSTIAPKIEMYTELACREHKPEYSVGKETFTSRPHGIHAAGLENTITPISYPLTSSVLDVLPTSLYFNEFSVNMPLITSPLFLNGSNSSNGSGTGDEDVGGDEDETDPNLCFSDPEVQAAAAELIIRE